MGSVSEPVFSERTFLTEYLGLDYNIKETWGQVTNVRSSTYYLSSMEWKQKAMKSNEDRCSL